MEEHLDYDEESLKDKVKRHAGFFTMIASGLLSLVHILSHVVPAIAVLGFSLGENNPLYEFVSNEYMQFVFIPFVFLGFWYMYRDHQHHKHEKELRRELTELREKIKEFEKRRKNSKTL